MYKESIKFHKVAMPFFIWLCLMFYLTGCSGIKLKRDTKPKRTDDLIKCVNTFLEQGVKASSSYKICDGIYGRTE